MRNTEHHTESLNVPTVAQSATKTQKPRSNRFIPPTARHNRQRTGVEMDFSTSSDFSTAIWKASVMTVG